MNGLKQTGEAELGKLQCLNNDKSRLCTSGLEWSWMNARSCQKDMGIDVMWLTPKLTQNNPINVRWYRYEYSV